MRAEARPQRTLAARSNDSAAGRPWWTARASDRTARASAGTLARRGSARQAARAPAPQATLAPCHTGPRRHRCRPRWPPLSRGGMTPSGSRP
eukprot:scaffold33052_cov36-Phaeocystis_antarctica.AAC.1